MNRKNLLKSIIPIGIYFGVEALYGSLWGMVAGISLCLAEMAYGYHRRRTIEKSTYLDIVVILIFGAVSFLLEMDGMKQYGTVTFSAMLSVLLGLSIWSRFNLFVLMGGRMVATLLADPFKHMLMVQSMKRMFYWSVAFTVFSGLVMLLPDGAGKDWLGRYAVWAFALGYVASEIGWNRWRNRAFRKEEWLPVVTPEGKVTGSAPRSFFHEGLKWLHPVIHLHVVTPDGLLLQKRPANKLIQPDKWDTATGGHVGSGEKLEQALQCEAFEEIGLQNFEARLLKQYVWESEVERELVFSFLTHHAGPFKAGEPEVASVKVWGKKELQASIGTGIFTPNLELELDWILPHLA